MREACGGQTADVLTTCLSSMSSRDPDQPTSSPSHESAPVARGAAFLVPQIAATWKWATSRIFLQSSPSPSSQVHMLKQDGILPPTTQAERPPASGEPLTQGAHEEPRIPIGLPALHQAVASSPAAMQPPIHPASMLPHEGTSTPPAMESAHVRWAAKRSRSMARRQGLFEHVQTIYLSTTEVPPLQGPVWGRPPRPPPLVMVAPCALGERSGPDGDETDTDEEVCLPRPEEEWLPRPLVKTKMKPRCFGPILEKLPEEQPVSQLPPGWTQVLLHRVRCGTAYTVVRTTCTHCGQVLTIDRREDVKRLAKHSHDPELARITAGSFGPDAWHHVRRSSAQKALPGSKARPAVQQTPQLPKGDASTAKRMKASGCSDDHGYLPIMQLLDILKETGSNPAGSQLPVSVRNKETSTRIHGVFHFGTGESTHWVYCNCDSCSALDSQQRMFRPAEFERHCGRLSSKKWKLTIQAWLPNGLQSVPSLGLGIGGNGPADAQAADPRPCLPAASMSDSESETDDSAGDFGIVRACDGDGGKVSAGRDETVEGVRWPFHQLAMEADGAQPHSSESSGPGELEERASPRSSRHPGSPSCNGSPVYRNGEGHWDDGDQGDSGISDCETESFSETPPLSDASEPSADETGYEQSAVQVLLDSR